MTSVQFLRTETFPGGREVVGILVLALGVAMVTDLAWCRIGTSEPVSQFSARTNPTAWGGLQVGCQ